MKSNKAAIFSSETPQDIGVHGRIILNGSYINVVGGYELASSRSG
jgi:hypothetical protein